MAMEQSMAKYSLKDIADYIDKKIHFRNVFIIRMPVTKNLWEL